MPTDDPQLARGRARLDALQDRAADFLGWLTWFRAIALLVTAWAAVTFGVLGLLGAAIVLGAGDAIISGRRRVD